MISITIADGSAEKALLNSLRQRSGETDKKVTASVTEILETVKARGDEAVKEYTLKFDGRCPEHMEVTRAQMDQAVADADPRFVEALTNAMENIKEFHSRQKQQSFIDAKPNGVIMGQRIRGLKRVGLYVPGGTAAYPSTVLMDAIPARIAGCERIVMVSPPDSTGRINPVILAAAHIAGVNEIYKVGGAQAVAALAFGTESVPKVDKIVGPGNAFVAEAKRQVYGIVSIDMIAGPSEIMIVADGDNNPRHIAADLLSQAEHDRMASAVLATDSMELAEAVAMELERQIPELLRADIARASIDNNGKIIITESIDDAIDIANGIAPEHLELCVDDPFYYLEKIKHAGSVFLGKNCPEALGDYLAGTNHTLPTSGTARFSSPLSVDDFVKKTQYIYYDRQALGRVRQDVEYFAKQEGLTAHARSAVIRFEDEK
jgi:histidinol dehydrogenase